MKRQQQASDGQNPKRDQSEHRHINVANERQPRRDESRSRSNSPKVYDPEIFVSPQYSPNDYPLRSDRIGIFFPSSEYIPQSPDSPRSPTYFPHSPRFGQPSPRREENGDRHRSPAVGAGQDEFSDSKEDHPVLTANQAAAQFFAPGHHQAAVHHSAFDQHFPQAQPRIPTLIAPPYPPGITHPIVQSMIQYNPTIQALPQERAIEPRRANQYEQHYSSQRPASVEILDPVPPPATVQRSAPPAAFRNQTPPVQHFAPGRQTTIRQDASRQQSHPAHRDPTPFAPLQPPGINYSATRIREHNQQIMLHTRDGTTGLEGTRRAVHQQPNPSSAAPRSGPPSVPSTFRSATEVFAAIDLHTNILRELEQYARVMNFTRPN